jgi:hypothetical protein
VLNQEHWFASQALRPLQELIAEIEATTSTRTSMVDLQPIFKKAYLALVAGGFAYMSWLCAMTYPGIQRAYVLTFNISMLRKANWFSRVLYMNFANPAIWQDLNDVENYGFLSMPQNY